MALSSTMSILLEAVREYLELNDWKTQEIKTALAEADADDFASSEEVAATFGKWGVNTSQINLN